MYKYYLISLVCKQRIIDHIEIHIRIFKFTIKLINLFNIIKKFYTRILLFYEKHLYFLHNIITYIYSKINIYKYKKLLSKILPEFIILILLYF